MKPSSPRRLRAIIDATSLARSRASTHAVALKTGPLEKLAGAPRCETHHETIVRERIETL
ncbi:MAG: hypothetical protein KF901_05600 [Myxococcales bacterium]|nr:hypothetical protein [Myxococcales bacterium]